MGGKDLSSHLNPLVKTLKKRDGEGVIQTPVHRTVVDRIAPKLLHGVVSIQEIVLGDVVCLIYSPVVLEVKGMDKAGYGHVFVLYP